MLEKLPPSDWKHMCFGITAERYEKLDLATLQPGAVVQIRTRSGNAYLLEVEGPRKARVVRLSPRLRCPQQGQLGIRSLQSSTVEVGKSIVFANLIVTSSVRSVSIIHYERIVIPEAKATA